MKYFIGFLKKHLRKGFLVLGRVPGTKDGQSLWFSQSDTWLDAQAVSPRSEELRAPRQESDELHMPVAPTRAVA